MAERDGDIRRATFKEGGTVAALGTTHLMGRFAAVARVEHEIAF